MTTLNVSTTRAERSLSWLEHVECTEGWLSIDEAKLLHELAANVRTGCIVEIGCYRGRSTIALAAGAPDGVAIHVVDPHAEQWRDGRLTFAGGADRAAFFRAMLDSGFAERINLLNTSSEIIAPGWTEPVGLLWIDGDHSEAGVRRDWACWQPHLIDDAIVVFDDAHDPGVGPYHLINDLLEQGVIEHHKNVGKTRSVFYRGG
jgi:predicted O-methyltransferase YrrM